MGEKQSTQPPHHHTQSTCWGRRLGTRQSKQRMETGERARLLFPAAPSSRLYIYALLPVHFLPRPPRSRSQASNQPVLLCSSSQKQAQVAEGMRPERGGAVAAELMAGGGAGGSGPSPWRTPTPYLFLGFGVMMGLIIVALLVLTCTRRRSSRRREAGGGAEKAASVRGVLVPLDREAPRVVVIMAGDDLPSFLASAKPLAVAAAAPRRDGDEAV